MATIYSEIDSNKRKTWLIMALFTALVTVVVIVFAYALGYRGSGALGYAGFALVITGVINFFSYYYSDRVVMAIAGAKQIQKKDSPQLYNVVENLSIGSGLPMPKIYVVEDPSPNAFATGRNPQNASIAVHTGLLEMMDKQELEGVLAHELSHIGNYDSRLMTVVVILVGMIALLADFFLRSLWFGGRDEEDRGGNAISLAIGVVVAILAPIAAQLIQLAISRRREFLADASGALLTRYPDELASALVKIKNYGRPSRTATAATAHLYFSNPFGSVKAKSWFLNLFSTHPPIDERIKRLEEM